MNMGDLIKLQKKLNERLKSKERKKKVNITVGKGKSALNSAGLYMQRIILRIKNNKGKVGKMYGAD